MKNGIFEVQINVLDQWYCGVKLQMLKCDEEVV